MSVKVKFRIGNKKGITANYTVKNDNPIRTIFRIGAASTAFSALKGSPYDNANLKEALDLKADKSELDADIAAVDEAISNIQTVVENNYNTLDTKIDNVNSDLSGDISTLENTVNSNNTAVNNRIDATNRNVSNLSTTVANNNTAINNRVDGIVNSFDGDISNLEIAIQNEAATRANNDTLLARDINTLRNDLTSEISNRTSADNTLQDNIDNIQNTIDNYGDIVSYNASDFATAAQGLLAESALQPNDNISELNNDAGYITSADLPTIDQTFDGTSANAQSGVAIQSELSTNYVKSSAEDTSQGITSSIGYLNNIAPAMQLNWGNYQFIVAAGEGATLMATDTSTGDNCGISAIPNGIIIAQDSQQALLTLSSNSNLEVNGTEVQSQLVSGTNIKTLNNINLLGSGDITIADLTTTAQINALNSGATSTNIGQITTNQNNIADIRSLIPAQATSTNQLADKSFVNSSIATNTANFIGTFNSVAELEAYTGTLTNNDYAFVATTDTAGNTLYDRYKYNADTQEWKYEYELNNSSFTAQQWASINSGITSGDVTLIGTALQPNDNISELTNDAGYITSASLPTVNNGTLDIQVNGASVGTFTANQSGNTTANIVVPDSATWGNITGTLSNQTDLQNALNGKYDASNPDGYITGITSSDVTTALGYTPYNASNPNGYTSNIGTVTSVNNIQPVNGNVTLSIPTATSDLTNDSHFATENYVDTGLATKQDTLVSGTNIKTINNQSLLGSGNISTLGLTYESTTETLKFA